MGLKGLAPESELLIDMFLSRYFYLCPILVPIRFFYPIFQYLNLRLSFCVNIPNDQEITVLFRI